MKNTPCIIVCVRDSHCHVGAVVIGLCNKRLKRYEDALDSFYKLHAILRNSPQVIYQIADMYPYSSTNNTVTTQGLVRTACVV